MIFDLKYVCIIDQFTPINPENISFIWRLYLTVEGIGFVEEYDVFVRIIPRCKLFYPRTAERYACLAGEGIGMEIITFEKRL